MARNKRTKIQREKDRQTIAELYLRGWSQQRIAAYLELHQSMINYELKKIKATWRERTVEDFNLHVQQELLRLSMLEVETWDAWTRSQQAKEQTLQEKLCDVIDGYDGDSSSTSDGRIKAQKRTESRTGDPRFLEHLLKIVEARCRLLGLYPKEAASAAITSPNDVLQLYLRQSQPSVSPGVFNPLDALS